LKSVGNVGKRVTGTVVRFWPDPGFFDTVKVHVPKLKRLLRAKAVLCPGLTISFHDENNPDNDEEWYFEDGLQDYLTGELEGYEKIPEASFLGHFHGNDEEVDWAILWSPDADDQITESYVNLIPTPQGGTHVAGLRTGLTDAMREFCEFRDMLPRGLRLTPDDIWDKCNYVLSARLKSPQFTHNWRSIMLRRDCEREKGLSARKSAAAQPYPENSPIAPVRTWK
jgi:topoisomerase-4 subunit B